MRWGTKRLGPEDVKKERRKELLKSFYYIQDVIL